MSSPTPSQDPEVVVIKEKPDNGNVWLWAIVCIIVIAIILIVVGMCMSKKHREKLVYMNAQAPSYASTPSYASAPPSGLQGGAGSFLTGGSAVSVAPLSASVLNSSMAPMSFMPY